MMTTYSKFSISLAVSEAAKALGYELREQQSKVAESFTSGRDVFVSLPTGSGKTLCYSVLPGTFDRLRETSSPSSIIIVVSPLSALMRDQVSSLEKKGLSSICVEGALTSDNDMANIATGRKN